MELKGGNVDDDELWVATKQSAKAKVQQEEVV